MGAGHVCLGGGFINENDAFGLQVFLFLLSVLTLLLHVGAILFRGPGRFFCRSAPACVKLYSGVHSLLCGWLGVCDADGCGKSM